MTIDELTTSLPGGILNPRAQAKAAAYYMASYSWKGTGQAVPPSPTPSPAPTLGPAQTPATAPVHADGAATTAANAKTEQVAKATIETGEGVECERVECEQVSNASPPEDFDPAVGSSDDDQDQEMEETSHATSREFAWYSCPWVVAGEVLAAYLCAREA